MARSFQKASRIRSFSRHIAVVAGSLLLATVVACAGNAQGSIPPTISPDIFAPIPTPRPFGLTPTPTSTPFIVPVPTVVAFPTVADSATVEPTATPSATIGAPGPEPTAAPTATPVPTVQPTPSPNPTVVPTVAPTATPEPTPEPTSTPEPTATPTPAPVTVAPGSLVFSLEEGSIALDPNNVSPEAISSGADVSNFSAAATFDNPINGTFGDFSYGVKFREADGLYHAISINSDGEVRYLEGTVGEDESTDTFTVIETFDYSNVGTTGADSNSIHLTVVEDRAWLFVNGDFFVQFTVGRVGVSSDVQFIAELENETQISGAATQLAGLAVRSGESATSSASITMVKEQGQITTVEATGTAGTFLVEAEFVSGYERILGKWTVGFEFTDPASETTHWILINNSKQWKHFRRVGPSGPIEEIAGGTHNGILRDRGDVNKIQVLSQNGIQQLFINGSLIGTVDIQPEFVPVQIAAFSGFADSDQQPGFPTEMRNYSVWTFGN